MNARVPVFVLNLAADEQRWTTFEKSFEPHPRFCVKRINAVPGLELPIAGRQMLTDNAGWAIQAGEIGCFLSHVKAWEAVEKTKEAFALVLEDDAAPVNLGRIFHCALPREADFVFLNERMSLGTRFDDRAPIPLCLPVSEALKKLNETQEGVGTDGYLITPHGARKMLEAVRLDLCFGHVDWRVLHYSVKLELLDKDFAGTRVERVLKHDINKHRPPRWGILNSFVLSSPLIYEKGIGSSRARANEEALQETLC